MASIEVNPISKFGFLSIPATVLIVLPQFTDPINLPKLLVLVGVTFCVTVLFLSLRQQLVRSLKNPFETFAFGIYIALIVSITISSFAGSDNYIRVLFGTFGRNNGLLYYLCAITLSILLFRTAITQYDLYYLTKVIDWTSILFAIYCLVQLLNFDPINWINQYNRVTGTLGNPNFASAMLAMFSIYWAHKLLTLKEKKSDNLGKQFFAISAFSISLALLSYSTESLQGPVIISVGILVLIWIFLMSYSKQSWVVKLIPIFGVLGIAGAFLTFLGFGPLGDNFEQYTLKLRSWYAFFGFKAMMDNPLFGVGVDNYIYAFRKYRTEEFVFQYGNQLSSNNAHSIPFQIGATFGLPVFIFYCALQFLVLYRSIAILSSREKNLTYVRNISIVWILVFFQSLLSIEIIGLGIINWILGAIILSAPRLPLESGKIRSKFNSPEVAKARPLPPWVGALTLASFSVGIIPSIILAREESAYAIVTQLRPQGEEEKIFIEKKYTELSNFSFWDPTKVNRLLPALYSAGLDSEAENLIFSIYKVEPKDAYVNDVVATYYQNSGDYKKEIEFREKIRELAPLDFRLEGILARAYFDAGETPKLRGSVDRLKELAPESDEYSNSVKLLNELETRDNP